MNIQGKKYFTEFTVTKFTFYVVAVTYVLLVSLVVCLEPFLITPTCHLPYDDSSTSIRKDYPNPDYVNDACRRTRYAILLFLNREECSFARRLVASTILGGVIGWERRQADRPAGIRTMALVSLASCLFTIASAFAFRSGPQDWDASRISAAIPSGVGFLGAGLIFKEQQSAGDGMPVVHGLTTAASLWMSAAVGIACGGELYFAASFTAAILLLLLRFGPRISDSDDEDEDDLEVPIEMPDNFEVSNASTYGTHRMSESARLREGETASLVSNKTPKRKSVRNHPHLV